MHLRYLIAYFVFTFVSLESAESIQNHGVKEYDVGSYMYENRNKVNKIKSLSFDTFVKFKSYYQQVFNKIIDICSGKSSSNKIKNLSVFTHFVSLKNTLKINFARFKSKCKLILDVLKNPQRLSDDDHMIYTSRDAGQHFRKYPP